MRPVLLQRGPQDEDTILTEGTVLPDERAHRVLAATTRSQQEIPNTAGYPNASSQVTSFSLPTDMDEDFNPQYVVGEHRVRTGEVERYLLGQSMVSTSVREQARDAQDPYVQGDPESSDSSADRSDYQPYGPPGSGEDQIEWNRTGTLLAPKLAKRYHRK